METTTRKILHIDMDAFYASVEQRDNPDLRGKPVAVGQADGRGVVAAASYEARRYGIRSAMSSSKARRMCRDLIFVDCRFDVYKAVSEQIHQIFHRYTDIIEPISLDEAFLDVTENIPGIPLAVDIAREIKRAVRDELGLVASAGVSFNKFLAKIASDYRKPDGLCVIPPERAGEFIARMPVESFWGVGPVTAARMHSLGIYTGADLRRLTRGELRMHFGKAGAMYWNFARGIDTRPVEAERERRSVGVEKTLEENIIEREDLDTLIRQLALELEERLRRRAFSGHTVTLKIKFDDFTVVARSVTDPDVGTDADSLAARGELLLDRLMPVTKPVRLMGLTLGNSDSAARDSHQLLLDI